jgi:hypothetical protein
MRSPHPAPPPQRSRLLLIRLRPAGSVFSQALVTQYLLKQESSTLIVTENVSRETKIFLEIVAITFFTNQNYCLIVKVEYIRRRQRGKVAVHSAYV